MTLVKRSTKGSALTFDELDGNFTHLGHDGTYHSAGVRVGGYRTGQVIEELHSLCNGTDLRGRATMTNVTAQQDLTTSYATATGSQVTNYTPPVGATMVVYEFNFHISYVDAGGISHWRFYYDIGGGVIEAESFRRTYFSYYAGSNPIFRVPITLGASAGVSSDAILTDVRPTLNLKWDVREYGASNEQKLHTVSYWDGGASNLLSKPQIMIKAIA